MQDPYYEVRWITTGTYGSVREHKRAFGKTESQEAVAFAKGKPCDYDARVVKIQEVWSRDEQDQFPS